VLNLVKSYHVSNRKCS